MYYVVVKQSPKFRQMTLEEFLFQENAHCRILNENTTNTRTYATNNISDVFSSLINCAALINSLSRFNKTYEELHNKPKQELYDSFHIPKRSGGLRKIDAPKPELMDALRRLKIIFEDDFGALYHTSAFAYVKNRSTIDAVKRHQKNESKWFGKYDLSNFFGSTTVDFIMQMFSMIFPFSEVIKDEKGRAELKKALSLCVLDGVLPQGTPISPLITNIMMIPIDYKLSNTLRNFNNQKFIYTRYADDFIISSRYTFKFKDIEKVITDILTEFNAPFSLNSSKTRYGSSSGSNWNLGVILNKDNNITVGHKKKRQFQAMLSSYIMDKKSGKEWDLSDIRTMDGYRSYYRMVEGENIDKIIQHINTKFNVDVLELIKGDLN